MENDIAKVRTYIVDDDPVAIALLRKLLESYDVEIIGATGNLRQAHRDMADLQPELLFLDVEMPTITGLEFWTQLAASGLTGQCKVVFYTGYDKYLLEALRRQAFDYMLKPATPAELAAVMTRFYAQRQTADAKAGATTAQPKILISNAVGEHVAVQADDIVFFRFTTGQRQWEVVMANGESYMLRHRTTADVILNYSPNYVQVHKRYIVNVRKVQKIVQDQLVLCPPMAHITELHLSKNYRHTFMARFYSM